MIIFSNQMKNSQLKFKKDVRMNFIRTCIFKFNTCGYTFDGSNR